MHMLTGITIMYLLEKTQRRTRKLHIVDQRAGLKNMENISNIIEGKARHMDSDKIRLFM